VSPEDETPTVLVVDDEQAVADVYALRLEDAYETRVAYGGPEALESLDETVDVVLLDRRMPDIHGDDVLAEIHERDADCRVIMLTAVDPDFDIIDMPFDDYLCKPVKKEDLVGAIDQQLRIQRYDEQLSEYLELTSKLAVLESELSTREFEGEEKLRRLEARADKLKTELNRTLEGFEDIETAFQDIGRYN